MKYAIWNNKGGVGKSFLTFALSTEYARLNPEKDVFVIDMCPQANVSEIILGGNGSGAEALQNLIQGGANRLTIGGYFDTRLQNPHSLTGDETSFFLKAKEYNDNMPDNLLLIAGDPSLEVQTEAINQIAAQTLPPNTWKNVHSWLKNLTTALSEKYPNATFFIDCNPSFAAYTELAIVASDKLIIPCTADGSSARAIMNIGQLIYGHNVPDQYKEAIFSKRAEKEQLGLPSIHMVILNRSTQYNDKASKAFGAMFEKIKENVIDLLTKEQGARGNALADIFKDIPDTHSVAIVASHLGMPIHKIKVGNYEVHGEHPKVNKEPLERYRNSLEEVSKSL